MGGEENDFTVQEGKFELRRATPAWAASGPLEAWGMREALRSKPRKSLARR